MPPAADMNMLEWDFELESGAYEYAKGCSMKPSDLSTRPDVGESIWTSSNPDLTPLNACLNVEGPPLRQRRNPSGKLGYVHIPHPSYSPEIFPCDYHYFLNLYDLLVGRGTITQADLDNNDEHLISTRPRLFWNGGTRKLADRWQQGH
ncbi:unnamed protein product [Heligmosomoides polygyrus]|uniref:MAM domain-containing protein n=1 Tax=Heligmosomoides polygyrus TaxID=6339 RepID=A0A183FDA2_HELPZ|nr:unnamed protein product [Heligmosomoides polygyrus]